MKGSSVSAAAFRVEGAEKKSNENENQNKADAHKDERFDDEGVLRLVD